VTIQPGPISQQRHRFQTLDALRGVAAIVVVIYHNRVLFGWTPQRGYLAVDLFFNLSGFVLSYAYQSRLDRGLPSTAFLRARIVRLGPLYLLALAIGVAATGLAGTRGWLHFTWKEYLEYLGLGLFLMPAHSAVRPGMPLFPYNYPSWTLFLELLMNIGHALFLRRLRTVVLASICGASSLLLVVIYLYSHNLNAGWDWNTLFTVGISRVVFSYTCGMLLFRRWSSRRYLVRLPASLLLLLSLAALVLPLTHQALVSLFTILLLIPAIVYAGSLNEPGNVSERIFGPLGAASYAIYVLHAPFCAFFLWVWPTLVVPARRSGVLMLAALVVFSLVVDRFYDTPIRKALRTASTKQNPLAF
jgi:peptidoglycan/LPS O-acetylase OafA/YrhL